MVVFPILSRHRRMFTSSFLEAFRIMDHYGRYPGACLVDNFFHFHLLLVSSFCELVD